MSGVELGAPPAPVEEPPSPVVVAAEPVIDAATVEPGTAAPEPVAEPVAEPEPEPAPVPQKEPRGAVAELIQRREEARLRGEEAKQLRERLAEYERGIAEGRILVKPAPTTADKEAEYLTAQAKELGLVKEDGTPDIDAARRVEGVIQRTVAKAMAPAQQQVQTLQAMTMQERANATMATIWTEAQAKGIPADALAIAEQEFRQVMAQPNAELMLSQREIADTVFQRAMGKAFMLGKLAAPAAPAPKVKTPAIITEAGGKRGPAAAAIQLSPGIAAVYSNAGIDPNKTPSVTTLKIDPRGGVEL